MDTYKYYIDFYNEDYAKQLWLKDCDYDKIHYPQAPLRAFQEWLNDSGYSDSITMHMPLFKKETQAINAIKKNFSHTQARVQRVILTDDTEDGWEFDDSFEYEGYDNFSNEEK